MRATNAVARHQAKKKVMKKARGYFGARHRQLKQALPAEKRAEQSAFIGRGSLEQQATRSSRLYPRTLPGYCD